MSVSEIVKTKALGAKVFDISPTDSVEAATRIMSRKNIGALVVLDSDGQITGIVTERDIIHGIAERSSPALEMEVRELMTEEVIRVKSSALASKAMEIMTENGFRHLPVETNGILAGIISAGDIVRYRIEGLLKVLRSDKIGEYDEQY